MTNYTPEYFTDIRGPEEKPTVPGFYVSSVILISYLSEIKNGRFVPSKSWFDYFDGERWFDCRRERQYPDSNQSRYWFGLKEKP